MKQQKEVVFWETLKWVNNGTFQCNLNSVIENSLDFSFNASGYALAILVFSRQLTIHFFELIYIYYIPLKQLKYYNPHEHMTET